MAHFRELSEDEGDITCMHFSLIQSHVVHLNGT